ncbi:hypothetical protein AVEN_275225-1 [Araneus ventricosus]|uniref:Uncharacterized protein n=1 Tax=Araneus ventricosus TaxID=182803 RepID=A0A4Y2T903_ARAVE|nr:hypothetical protein AVEN_275225-1 [Araneus ventricosus]
MSISPQLCSSTMGIKEPVPSCIKLFSASGFHVVPLRRRRLFLSCSSLSSALLLLRCCHYCQSAISLFFLTTETFLIWLRCAITAKSAVSCRSSCFFELFSAVRCPGTPIGYFFVLLFLRLFSPSHVVPCLTKSAITWFISSPLFCPGHVVPWLTISGFPSTTLLFTFFLIASPSLASPMVPLLGIGKKQGIRPSKISNWKYQPK